MNPYQLQETVFKLESF